MAISLREQMPQVAAIIDDLRKAFGEDCINSAIRAGIKGKPSFYATENGHTIGTPAQALVPAPWVLSAREQRMERLKVANQLDIDNSAREIEELKQRRVQTSTQHRNR